MTDNLPCIPDFADFVPDQYKTFVRSLKCCRPSGDQLYSLLYGLGTTFNFVSQGILLPVETELESTFVRFSIVMTAPWVLMMIALIVLLISARVITPLAGIFFIVIALLIAALAIYWVLADVRNTTTIVFNQIRDGLINNFNNNQDEIIAYLFGAYTLNESCNPAEVNVCCGFDDRNCISGCNDTIIVDPTSIAVNTTGLMTIGVGSDDSSTSGSVIVPPEITGASGPISYPFSSVPFAQSITYQTGPNPGVFPVEFILHHGTGPYYSESIPVVIYAPTAPPAIMAQAAPLSGAALAAVEPLPGLDVGGVPELDEPLEPEEPTPLQMALEKLKARPCRSCVRKKN